jgi:hypothetical protein
MRAAPYRRFPARLWRARVEYVRVNGPKRITSWSEKLIVLHTETVSEEDAIESADSALTNVSPEYATGQADAIEWRVVGMKPDVEALAFVP